MPKSVKRREGLRRTNYAMLIGIVYLVTLDFCALFFPPGTLGVWRLAGFAFFLVVVLIRFLISEGFADVAIAQHTRMWRVLRDLDPERARAVNQDEYFEDNQK